MIIFLLNIILLINAQNTIDIKNSVCAKISSSKYKSQCEMAIHKKKFSENAIEICKQELFDYDRFVCVSAIANKKYSNEDLVKCKSMKKNKVFKCLSV